MVGELENALATAQLVVGEMVAVSNGYAFPVENQLASDIFVRKTIAARRGQNATGEGHSAVSNPNSWWPDRRDL